MTSPRSYPSNSRSHIAAQYIRMSTDSQSFSTLNQRDAIARYAQDNNLTIVKTYADEGRSGLKIQGRSGLSSLIADVLNGAEFGIILVYDVSRWGRFQDIDESAHYEYICRSAGVMIRYCAEQFDHESSIVNSVLKTIKRAMAGEYSRELSVKVFVGQSRLVSLGFRIGGRPGFGLRRCLLSEDGTRRMVLERGQHKAVITDRVVLVPGPADEVEVVQAVFKMIAYEGMTCRQAADALNDRNAVRCGKTLWTKALVWKLLTNEKYAGHNVWAKESFKLRGAKTQNPSEQWIRCNNAFEPLIDEETFRAASMALSQRDFRSIHYVPKPFLMYNKRNRLNLSKNNTKEEDSIEKLCNNKLESFTINGFKVYRVCKYGKGWQVSITFNFKTVKLYFADSVFGSAELARKAADKAAAKNRELFQEALALRRRLTARSNTRSGIAGVSYHSPSKKGNPFWQARWIEEVCGRIILKRFYVLEHGEEKSKLLAIEARRRSMEKDRKRLNYLSSILEKQLLDAAAGKATKFIRAQPEIRLSDFSQL